MIPWKPLPCFGVTSFERSSLCVSLNQWTLKKVEFQAWYQVLCLSSRFFLLLGKQNGVYKVTSYANPCQNVSLNTSIQKYRKFINKTRWQSIVKQYNLMESEWLFKIYLVALRRRSIWKVWLVAKKIPWTSRVWKWLSGGAVSFL